MSRVLKHYPIKSTASSIELRTCVYLRRRKLDRVFGCHKGQPKIRSRELGRLAALGVTGCTCVNARAVMCSRVSYETFNIPILFLVLQFTLSGGAFFRLRLRLITEPSRDDGTMSSHVLLSSAPHFAFRTKSLLWVISLGPYCSSVYIASYSRSSAVLTR